MNKSSIEIIMAYRKHVERAQKEFTKKEHFKDLLNRLYHDSPEILAILDAMSSGAEKTILNIPREDRLHRGSADTLYNRVIIEFENNLGITLEHAKEQLAGYLLGEFNTGEGYNFTLIASDFLEWRVYTIDIENIASLNSTAEHELKLVEIDSARFILTERNAEDFYYWIDRFLFKKEKHLATLDRIEEAFGYKSNVFIESLRQLTEHFTEAKRCGEVQVSFEQWGKFLSIAYGSFDASENNFLIHTYLSVFSKMLAYFVLSNVSYISNSVLLSIIDGSVFYKFNIRNFVDNDFYYWVKNHNSFKVLRKMFRLIAQEISTFNFENVNEDVLKGVYQDLIDLDTRHALGEYYTPDWLCEKVVQEYHLKNGDRILDPACGSGSFLRIAYDRLKKLNPEMTTNELNDSIYGIDIHPLSVQISKTTMLLAMGKDILESRIPIQINVILANTLKAPDGVEDLFDTRFKMEIDRDTLELGSQILDDVKSFDEALDICEELAEQTLNTENASLAEFSNILSRKIIALHSTKQVYEDFYNIYVSLKKVKKNGRDSIWKFIVENLYKPYFLKGKFDYVFGNPPWFTYSSIDNRKYQNLLKELAHKYNVDPEKVADFPHLEIAAIFLAYCSNYFLKPKAELAFVLPRSFFSASHLDKIRGGRTKGFRIVEVWDMLKVEPLFKVPSCVIFAQRLEPPKEFPEEGLLGRVLSAKLPGFNCNLTTAQKHIHEERNNYYYCKLGGSTAITLSNVKDRLKSNPYKKEFKQGATIVPRSCYFVDLDQATPPDFENRIVCLTTSEAIRSSWKKPWRFVFEDKIESNFLFYTALANSILPFALYDPVLVVLPITIEINKHGSKQIELHDSRELRKLGYLNTSRWFMRVERAWNENKTEKNQNISAEDYLNWQGKLKIQGMNTPYLVIYNASAKNANATIVKRTDLALEFIVASVAYVFYTNDINEAYYLAAFLNSEKPNSIIEDFQARGLFGARHVHKKILDVYFPRFDKEDYVHMDLAKLSKIAHTQATKHISTNPPEKRLSATRLGRYRLMIKEHLKDTMKTIDDVVEQLMK